MATFDKPDQVRSTPFGKNQYLRSTKNTQFQPYTCAAAAVPTESRNDGNGVAHTGKLLQSGELMAKITSGPSSGKVGPFQAGVTDGRQTAANIVGVNDTFLPWQLDQRDVDIAVLYHGTVKAGWCYMRDAAGARVPVTGTELAALIGKTGLDVTSK